MQRIAWLSDPQRPPVEQMALSALDETRSVQRAAASVLNRRATQTQEITKNQEHGTPHPWFPDSGGDYLFPPSLSGDLRADQGNLQQAEAYWWPAVLADGGVAAVLAGGGMAAVLLAGGVMAVLAAGGVAAVDAGAVFGAGAGVGVADSSLWPLQALRASTAASDRAQIKG
jgi:hypothetical protein